MALAQMTVHRTAALVLLAAAMLAVFAGCNSGSSSTSTTPSSRRLAIFRGGSGNTETAHFITDGDWELYWTCDPGLDSGTGDYVPFSLWISVMNGGPSLVMTPVNTTYENPSDSHSVGTVEVHQSGEQWLDVAAGGAGGNWIVIVSVPQSDTGAKLV